MIKSLSPIPRFPILKVNKLFLFLIVLTLGSLALMAAPASSGSSISSGYWQVDMDLFSRIRYNHFGGRSFQLGTSSPIDTGRLGFFGNLPGKNFDTEVKVGFKFEDRDANSIYQLKLDESYLRVNNLFGMMDVKFFDIGYGAGHENSIRPDLPVQGIQFYLRPIPDLTLSLGYGVSSEKLYLYPSSNGMIQTELNGQETAYSPNYHALKFDLIYDNYYIPFGFYYGVALVDNRASYLAKDYLPGSIEDNILHMSTGLSFDVLGHFKKGAMGFDAGFVIPLGTMSRDISIGSGGEHSYTEEFNYLFQIYGDTEITHGLGLRYLLLVAPDSYTKQKTLGNLYDEYFKEVFKISVTPRYSYGPVMADAGLSFGVMGGMTARSSISRKDSIIYKRGGYNNLVVETGLSWTPFPFPDLGRDMTIRGYYKIDLGDLDNSGDHLQDIGLQLSLSLNSLALD